ncbi:hypothetical protein J2I47_13080 [Fibrella sp. HMF5335]|uniref:Uncharacterized protein n=1 Tax=Fibrella rubiginis TaxID=2817060 RepID=A0A939GGR0_9BACT|nr:hypothetical protein [Fibrella rubiginis]MBO0937483.1 hypothetical protein [Fibrella rubiginis]
MSYIAIPIPNIPGKQEIEIEVSINGQKQALHYRVELFYWADCRTATFDRVACIREMLSGYDQDWSLYYIGEPTDDFVPITFVRKEDLTIQRHLRQLA